MEKVKVGIVGAGAMGSGIAQIAAQNGHEVLIYDTRAEGLETSRSSLSKILNKLEEKGKIESASTIMSRFSFVDNLKTFSNCKLVVEAIVENLEAKRSVFGLLETIVSADTILASNTSSLSIAAISSAVNTPERVLGIHFFNPAPLMPLVEIIPSLATEQNYTDQAKSLIDSWGKVTVLAKDTPGFIVNRVARPFYSEPLKMYEEGVADMATIDWAMREMGGFRMGPFELMDLIGHDVNYVVTETVWTQFYYDPRFKPSITQKRLLEAGLLGRKSGRGFYHYGEEDKNPEPNTDPKLGKYIVERALALLINEAYDAVFMGVGSPEDIDTAMTKGVNYPKGLLAWSEELGLGNVLKTIDSLYEEFQDDRYRPNPLLKKLKINDKSIFSIGK